MNELLMCSPDFFEVNYAINPWMNKNIGDKTPLAKNQWERFYKALKGLSVNIKLIKPEKGLPDFVFTANAALIFENKAIISSFKHSERKGETEHYHKWFKEAGYETSILDINFEGAGDALYDRKKNVLYCGYGWRTDIEASKMISEILDIEVIPLKLINPNFYHLDVAFCPLSTGHVMVHLPAFSEESQKLIKTNFKDRLIEVQEKDANYFACNAVEIVNKNILLYYASFELSNCLKDLGYQIEYINLSEFIKAGGSAKCLTLKLKDGFGHV